MINTCTHIGNGSDQEKNHLGLAYSHAYTVLGTVMLSDKTKLYKLRNPWGSESYHGDWSDTSSKWTEQFRKEAGWPSRDDGIFFMNAKDFHE